MNENEINIRKQVDLHYGKTNHSENKNYVEFYFYACFYELFIVENSYWESELNGSEILEIMDLLKIEFNKNYVEKKYLDEDNHNVEVFHSANEEQVFAYFDLQKEPTDQNNMFYLGIRCNKMDENIILDKLINIYRKLKTTSPFSYDIWNNKLYYKVFNSYFYFYENRYTNSVRQLIHHNLNK